LFPSLCFVFLYSCNNVVLLWRGISGPVHVSFDSRNHVHTRWNRGVIFPH
jgi:hypothetical protein